MHSVELIHHFQFYLSLIEILVCSSLVWFTTYLLSGLYYRRRLAFNVARAFLLSNLCSLVL